MYNFLCQIFLNIFKYILFIKRTETVWSRDFVDIRVLTHFEFKTHKEIYVLNCFKSFQIYILGQMSQKNQARKKFEIFTKKFKSQNN